MRLFVAQSEYSQLNDWGRRFVPHLKSWIERLNNPEYQVAADPADADLILFLESNSYKRKRYISNLLREPLLQRYPKRTFTINYEPSPAGLLPGAYTGLVQGRFNPIRHRAGPYPVPPNALVDEFDPARHSSARPKLTCSFRGACSDAVRERIFRIFSRRSNPSWKVTKTTKWFTHTEDEKRDYLSEILDSKFVLCPRGLSPSSHRLFEVMALGRCPVIISDAWVPPAGIEWEHFSIRVAESEIPSLPEYLSRYESNWRDMGSIARRVWETHFSKPNRLIFAVKAIRDIQKARPRDYDDATYRTEWHTRTFQRKNRWGFDQRILDKCRRFIRKAKHRYATRIFFP